MPPAFKFITISNDKTASKIYDECGVSMVMVDLESKGKASRQPPNSWVSDHQLSDIQSVKSVLKSAELLVRVDSPPSRDKDQVEKAINGGADAIMLPYFFSLDDVRVLNRQIRSRVPMYLLVETLSAVENLEKILSHFDIEYVHVGLNDLSIEMGLPFMFQALMSKEVDVIAAACSRRGVPFGIGGIARTGMFRPSADLILSKHKQLGSKGVILNRSFCKWNSGESHQKYCEVFTKSLKEIDAAIWKWEIASNAELAQAEKELGIFIEQEAEKIAAHK
tara:strand:- start:794 stop:1627 length:834 start_codon:yes stop_codon:yes gene_type:complete